MAMPCGAQVGEAPPATRPIVIALMATFLAASRAFALIEGGEGNDPIDNPRWPKGVAAVFNDPARVAFWVGPPFGGGQWHGEYRGDAKAFNAALAALAKLEHKRKRVVIHDGEGQSFWLNMNDQPDQRESARIDWSFVIWEDAAWQRQRELPVSLRPSEVVGDEPPVMIEAFAGGNIDWTKVVIPAGIEIVDQRLEAHGFTSADGVVVEGRVTALDTLQPLAARMVLARVEPRQSGGYDYPIVQELQADVQGRWVMKSVPAGRYRVVAAADGYVDRVIGHLRVADQPAWHEFNCDLARPGPIAGIVADDAGKPLADVRVDLHDVAASDGSRYEGPDDYSAETDVEGRFRIEQAPIGTARVSLGKDGYVAPGLGRETSLPAGVALMMSRAGELRVTVEFGDVPRPNEYIVEIEPAGGNKVGSWGGSGTINNDNKIVFKNVPAGRYTLTGRPNPAREGETSKPITVDVQGETRVVSLAASQLVQAAEP